MKKKLSCIIIILISIILYKNINAAETQAQKRIELPFQIKWDMTLKQISELVKVPTLSMKNDKWAVHEKDNHRYWMYFEPSSKKLSQISVMFSSTTIFAKYINSFVSKYEDLKVKSNLYKDEITTVSIDPSIRPQVIYIKN